jgi:uracil-DNA glycosylase family 4
MAFFGIPGGGRGRALQRPGVSDEFLHRNGCAACPLNNQAGLHHPHMEPTGPDAPAVYFLGEAPGSDEDRQGRQLAGAAGHILFHHLPARWLKQARFNNCVRTRPPESRAPQRVEVECCRPSVESDILEHPPRAVVGFGNVPLAWAGVSESGIALWSGRRVPVLIGGKAHWFFPISHPSAVQKDPKWDGLQSRRGHYGSELEFQFALHLRRALEAVEAGLPDPAVHTREQIEADIEWVDGSGGADDLDRVAEHLRSCAGRKFAGVDYETHGGLRPYSDEAKILTVSVSTIKDGTLAFAMDHKGAKWTREQRSRLDVLWKQFLYKARCRKVAHNLAFEMEWSAYFYGAACLRAGKWGDSLAQAYVIDQRPGGHNLDFLVRQYFGFGIKSLYRQLNMSNLDAEPLTEVLRYNGPDSKYGLLLYLEQARELERLRMVKLYHEHLERVPAAVLTQLKGIPISQEAVLRLGRKYIPRMVDAERAMRDLDPVKKFERTTGKKFRPSANDDVKHIANKILGNDLPNVDEAALETVDHVFAREMVKWRKASKVYGTYVMPTSNPKTRTKLERERLEALRELLGPMFELKEVNPSRIYSDGLAHPQTNVNRTRTSRTSADDFNYQNWPKRGAADAVEVRGIVKPLGADEVIVSFDYGQIQARNVGMESLDKALLKAFWEDYDIHTAFMEHLARIYPRWIKEGAKALASDSKLQKKYRNDVKHGFVFASFFGSGAKKVAGVLDIPMSAAEALRDIFWDQFGGIKDWHSRLERDYYEKGYVTGHAGYRRWAPVSYNERINSPIQADESKIVLDAMVRLSKIDHDLLQASMEIHDDLTFVWPKKRVPELAEIVLREMMYVPFEWARVTPIVVEMSVGEDWARLQSPIDAGFPDFGKGEFASHKYDGIDMPREMPNVAGQ